MYRITCLLTRMVYIGSTTDTARRFLEHQDQLLRGVHSNRALSRTFNELGPKAFTFEVLEVLKGRYDEVQLTLMEQRYLDLHPRRFNVRPAGSDWYLTSTPQGKAAVKRSGGRFINGKFYQAQPSRRAAW